MIKKSTDDVKALAAFPTGGPNQVCDERHVRSLDILPFRILAIRDFLQRKTGELSKQTTDNVFMDTVDLT